MQESKERETKADQTALDSNINEDIKTLVLTLIEHGRPEGQEGICPQILQIFYKN